LKVSPDCIKVNSKYVVALTAMEGRGGGARKWETWDKGGGTGGGNLG